VDLPDGSSIETPIGDTTYWPQPNEAPDPFTIAPAPGAWAVEWLSLASGETVSGPGLKVSDTKITISTPPEIAGPAVLHLRRS
jgi:hypothetical protein